MPENSSVYKVPSFAKKEVYDFDTNDESLTIYQELSQIAEEIEACRLRNC